MEVYSNTLWQLKQEVPLGYLAHTLMEQDRLSPQAWCALGNANSLDQQHDDAIKCFSRATQLDPKFAYAFTLQGHEHVTNEEYEKAMAAFRGAISADCRHYNGWYGLGTVFEKMGKLDFAEKHYRKAAEINPNNATILVKIGLVRPRLILILLALLTHHRCSTASRKPSPPCTNSTPRSKSTRPPNSRGSAKRKSCSSLARLRNRSSSFCT
jgi:anaphase-promoting complex subunit 3